MQTSAVARMSCSFGFSARFSISSWPVTPIHRTNWPFAADVTSPSPPSSRVTNSGHSPAAVPRGDPADLSTRRSPRKRTRLLREGLDFFWPASRRAPAPPRGWRTRRARPRTVPPSNPRTSSVEMGCASTPSASSLSARAAMACVSAEVSPRTNQPGSPRNVPGTAAPWPWDTPLRRARRSSSGPRLPARPCAWSSGQALAIRAAPPRYGGHAADHSDVNHLASAVGVRSRRELLHEGGACRRTDGLNPDVGRGDLHLLLEHPLAIVEPAFVIEHDPTAARTT